MSQAVLYKMCQKNNSRKICCLALCPVASFAILLYNTAVERSSITMLFDLFTFASAVLLVVAVGRLHSAETYRRRSR